MSERAPLRMPREALADQYLATPDPWGFVTSGYERQKYDLVLSAIGGRHGNAIEIGCSVGVFTQRLAEQCDRLLAVDTVETAVDAARRRCSDLRQTEFRQVIFPEDLPEGRFDLVVLAEAGYYWSLADLDRCLDWLDRTLAPDGQFVLVHWTGGADFPVTGDEVHDHVAARTNRFLIPTQRCVEEFYRFDVFAGIDRPVA